VKRDASNTTDRFYSWLIRQYHHYTGSHGIPQGARLTIWPQCSTIYIDNSRLGVTAQPLRYALYHSRTLQAGIQQLDQCDWPSSSWMPDISTLRGGMTVDR
jgi:hypothetical protein